MRYWLVTAGSAVYDARSPRSCALTVRPLLTTSGLLGSSCSDCVLLCVPFAPLGDTTVMVMVKSSAAPWISYPCRAIRHRLCCSD